MSMAYRTYLREYTKCSTFTNRLGSHAQLHTSPDRTDDLDIDYEGDGYTYNKLTSEKIQACGKILWQKAIDKAKTQLLTNKQSKEKHDKAKSAAATRLLEETPDIWMNRMVDQKIDKRIKQSARTKNPLNEKQFNIDYSQVVQNRPVTEADVLPYISDAKNNPNGPASKGKGKGKPKDKDKGKGKGKSQNNGEAPGSWTGPRSASAQPKVQKQKGKGKGTQPQNSTAKGGQGKGKGNQKRSSSAGPKGGKKGSKRGKGKGGK